MQLKSVQSKLKTWLSDMVYVNNMKGIEFLLLAPEPCLNLHFTTNLFLSLSDFSLNISRCMHYQVPVLTHKLFSSRECIAVLSRSKIYRQYLKNAERLT